MKKQCTFSDVFVLGGLYQVCSCGNHLWSVRAKKIINVVTKNRDYAMLTDKDQNRIIYKNTKSQWCIKTIMLKFSLFVLLIYRYSYLILNGK